MLTGGRLVGLVDIGATGEGVVDPATAGDGDEAKVTVAASAWLGRGKAEGEADRCGVLEVACRLEQLARSITIIGSVSGLVASMYSATVNWRF